MIADVVIGLSYGDEGKGKVTHHLLKSGEYTHCLRFNGGCNAGHTIYHKGKKFVTHHIPAGVFFGVKSIIGRGCVVNLNCITDYLVRAYFAKAHRALVWMWIGGIILLLLRVIVLPPVHF